MGATTGRCCPYLFIIISVWVTNCYSVPLQSKVPNPEKKPVATALPISSGAATNGNWKPTSTTSSITNKGLSTLTDPHSLLTQRSKRDIQEAKDHFGMFPDAKNADDALQKFLHFLSVSKPKNTDKLDDYDEEFEPIDLVVGKEPGKMRSTKGTKAKNFLSGNGEEPTGVPIVLYQHRLHKKSSPFLREAARSSGYELDPRILKVIERVMFDRKLRDSQSIFHD